jgi:transcriptional regulator with XRE-family HTH domain
MSSFGFRLKEWRKQSKHQSQQSLADAMKVSRSTIAGWETSEPPTKAQCERLAEALGLSVDEVWGVAAPERAKPDVREHYEGLLAAQEGITDHQRSLLSVLNNLSRRYPEDDFAQYFSNLIMSHFSPETANVGKPLDALALFFKELDKLPPRSRRLALEGFTRLLKSYSSAAVQSRPFIVKD